MFRTNAEGTAKMIMSALGITSLKSEKATKFFEREIPGRNCLFSWLLLIESMVSFS